MKFINFTKLKNLIKFSNFTKYVNKIKLQKFNIQETNEQKLTFDKVKN